MRPFLLALAAGAACLPCARAADHRHFGDASLRAVQFVDAKEGWAVGDEGVVWHTIDGGETWERQPTGVRASLRSLHFLDPYKGWVAGREELSHGGGSVGVLLYTGDGGVSWRRLLTNAIPGLNHIRFGDTNHIRFGDTRTGYALGDGSEQYPSGVFRTRDGGRTWEPVKGPRSPGWLAGDYKDGQTGALTGAWSRLATLTADGFGTAKVDPLGVRSPLDLALRDGRGLAVGQGGLILSSSSGGARWGPTELKLPREVLAAWDFRALHWVGDHVWVVGRPGSVLLHSANRGAGWEILKTGQPLPLNGVFFFDEKRGWAVGELGLVLGTQDGGKTWKAQRRGGERAAVMFVHGRPADLPVDTLAVLGLEDGWLTACVGVTAPDPRSEAFARASDPQRLAGAVRQAGGAAGELLWAFPLPQHLANAEKGELLKFWTQLHGGPAETELVRQMVLALRTWRPDMVVTDHPDARVTGCAASALVAEALHEAFTKAGDPKAFPEQIEHLGLQPWRVSRVYALWDKAPEAQVTVDGDKDYPRLAASAREFAEQAAGLLAETPQPMPVQRCYRILDGAANSGVPHFLMDGLPRADVGVGRRDLPELPAPTEQAKKADRARRNLRGFAERPVPGLAEPEQLLAQMIPTLAGLPDDQGAAALHGMGSAYVRQGRWDLARETFQLMADRYPAHPRTIDAYRWLIRHASSGEAARRHELGHYHAVTKSTVLGPQGRPRGEEAPDYEVKQAASGAYEVKVPEFKSRLPADLPQGLKMQKVAFLKEGAGPQKWFGRSLDLGKRLAAFGPLFASDPAMQFCLQASRRRLGQFKEAQEYYAWFKTTMTDGPWREAAASELWLAEHTGQPPRPVTTCRQTPARPFLDGKFDDPCWQGLPPMVLRDAVEETAKEYPTEARFAYDGEFLYIALRCKHPVGKQVAPVKPRPRDADLRNFDRVSILIDLDRDYSTYYRLEVDQRGCVCEDCWGDRSWNPQWFVAVHSEADCWQIEAAIPLHQLTGERPGTGTVWACNVVRILPGRGVQGWSLPAGVEPRPEGMGLMFFRPEQPQVERRPAPAR